MKKLSYLLIWLFATVPAVSFADDLAALDEEEDVCEELLFEKEPDELKEIFSAIKEDKHINKERIKRIKELLKEKGWLDKSKHS